jgi:hypothetical protein
VDLPEVEDGGLDDRHADCSRDGDAYGVSSFDHMRLEHTFAVA